MNKAWIRVILESPYAGEVERNRLYALACSKDMFDRGEAVFASHLIYPRFLQAYNLSERAQGLEAGKAWIPAAQCMVIYTDFGVTSGMEEGIEEAKKHGVPILRRKLGWQLK